MGIKGRREDGASLRMMLGLRAMKVLIILGRLEEEARAEEAREEEEEREEEEARGTETGDRIGEGRQKRDSAAQSFDHVARIFSSPFPSMPPSLLNWHFRHTERVSHTVILPRPPTYPYLP